MSYVWLYFQFEYSFCTFGMSYVRDNEKKTERKKEWNGMWMKEKKGRYVLLFFFFLVFIYFFDFFLYFLGGWFECVDDNDNDEMCCSVALLYIMWTWIFRMLCDILWYVERCNDFDFCCFFCIFFCCCWKL